MLIVNTMTANVYGRVYKVFTSKFGVSLNECQGTGSFCSKMILPIPGSNMNLVRDSWLLKRKLHEFIYYNKPYTVGSWL